MQVRNGDVILIETMPNRFVTNRALKRKEMLYPLQKAKPSSRTQKNVFITASVIAQEPLDSPRIFVFQTEPASQYLSNLILEEILYYMLQNPK